MYYNKKKNSVWTINFVKGRCYCYNVVKNKEWRMKGEIAVAFTSKSFIALILGFGVYAGIIVLIILAILALIKYLKK